MEKVILYTTPTCPDCLALKRWLAGRGVPFEERDLTKEAVSREAKERYGVRIAPITVVGESFFYGTFEDQRAKLESRLGA